MPLTFIAPGPPEQAVEIALPFRVAAVTDAAAVDAMDASLRAAVDEVNPVTGPHRSLPTASAAHLVTFAGERLEAGTAELLRFRLRRRELLWFPVHAPGLPEADLVVLEPRAPGCAAAEELICHDLRFTGAPSTTPAAREWLREWAAQPQAEWARLSLILLEGRSDPQSAAARLGEALKSGAFRKPALLALAWRNLAVLMARLGATPVALELLAAAARQFPGCAEFPWLTALLLFRSGELAAAVRPLEQAVHLPLGEFAGSGGENSWRPRWLMGQIQERLGNQQAAVEHYHAGLVAQPAFAPAVEALLAMRSGEDCIAPLLPALRRLLHREPAWLPEVLRFLEANHASAARQDFARLFAPDTEPSGATRRAAAASPRRPVILFHAPLLVHSSVAGTSRQIVRHLDRHPEWTTLLQHRGYRSLAPESLPEGDLLRRGLDAPFQSPDLTIRHFWPFDFHRPAGGRLALITPWEYGAIPRRWVEPIRETVDEQWVPSEFVRQAFASSGIDPGHIHVIPNGVDPEVFCPTGPALRPPGARGFLFLFVGGAILRKGVDLLVTAFDRAFPAADDVTLVLKDLGSGSYYQKISLLPQIQRYIRGRRGPDIQIVTEAMDVGQLAALYRGCDAFVLPYRGEGFGMPIAEAMACGKPVITTGLGPAPEFCPSDCGYFVEARTVAALEPHLLHNDFARDLTWFEPDVEHLAATLRHVFLHAGEARERGTRGAQWIQSRYSWPTVLRGMDERIGHLLPAQIAEGEPPPD